MGFQISIPKNDQELERQIKALEYAIDHDIRKKDKCIHLAAHDKLVKEKIKRQTERKNGLDV